MWYLHNLNKTSDQINYNLAPFVLWPGASWGLELANLLTVLQNEQLITILKYMSLLTFSYNFDHSSYSKNYCKYVKG
jgi:hypothetical protein